MDGLEDDTQDPPKRQLRAALMTVTAVAVITWVTQFIEIESVLATGPLLGCTALIVAVTGARARNRPAKVLAALFIAVVLALFWGVEFFDWSPRRARFPFAVVGTLSLGVALTLVRAAWQASLRRPDPIVVPTSTLLPVPERPTTTAP